MMLDKKVKPFSLCFDLSFIDHLIHNTEEDTKDKGKLYKPVSKLTATESSSAKPKLLETKESKDKNLLKKDKKKSNLEMFKEELRA
jgi:hypothetical protein